MALTATKLKEERPMRTSRGWATTEQWEVADLDANGQYTGVPVDPISGLLTPGLPQYGNPHINTQLAGALVTSVVPIAVVSASVVIYLVSYRSWGLYTGVPRPGLAVYSIRDYIRLPVWRRYNVDGIVFYEEDKETTFPRQTIIRDEERSIGGAVASQIVRAIVRNAGKLFLIDGDWYVLSDKSSARYDGNTYTRAHFRFERPSEINAIGANDPLYGNDVAIPFLPALYQYVSRPSPVSSANQPIIAVVPPPVSVGDLSPYYTP